MHIYTTDKDDIILSEISATSSNVQTNWADVALFGTNIFQFMNTKHPNWYDNQTLGVDYTYPFECLNGSKIEFVFKIQSWGGIICTINYKRTENPAISPYIVYNTLQTSGSYGYTVAQLKTALGNGTLKLYIAPQPINSSAKDDTINNIKAFIFKGQSRVDNNSSVVTSTYAADVLLQNFFYKMAESVLPDFGEDSTTGGGHGEWDITTDTIDFPNLPTGSALETGLINMYKCDSTDLRDFGEYLWGNSFFNEISKIFNDPMEAFVSLNLFPVTPTIGDAKTPIKIGNVFASKSASVFVTAYPLTSQYLEFDCGTVNINEFFGSALDYNPYTQVQIYLPFIGFQNLSADDIMDGTITLKYHIDMLTGTCTALIKCVKSNKYNLASVLYSFAGSMNMSVPISASNYGQAMGTLINGITGIGIGAAMGGAPAMLGVSATGSAMNIMNTKATVQRSGGIVMNAGALGNLTPYIIITRPVQHKPEDYQKFKGWENNITYTLSALQGKGYTEIMYTHIEGLTATDEEKAEIEALLKDGVIL